MREPGALPIEWSPGLDRGFVVVPQDRELVGRLRPRRVLSRVDGFRVLGHDRACVGGRGGGLVSVAAENRVGGADGARREQARGHPCVPVHEQPV